MQPNAILRIQRKELTLFFASPVGYLFIGLFLAVTLFVFFWGEAFFARNVADVRPMFEWMPELLIFICAALSMRMWSEERRTGTLEFVATLPVSSWDFVLGKFFACWILLGVALALTLPLPITVAVIADLDWGPVIAGYVAALLLGGAYLAIGLFVSARTDSQIVSLILTTVVCGVFYLLGSPVLTDLVGGNWAELMRGLGSGSRFESITRGVLDLRDLYFYASLLVVFLTLNVAALEMQRWAHDGSTAHHRNWILGTGLLVVNLLAANLWLGQLTGLRADMTQGNQYSISAATRGYLDQLKEPMLIRGYFSNKTHPLLAPLVPQMQDLLTEFEIAGNGRVRVEIVDPAQAPALEDEANTKYGIRPVPFQVADRYQSSLVNSYFDVLVVYGDEYEVLGFRDLIEVKVASESQLDVKLRNPEFDLTRTIKKVLYGFQGGNSIFANVTNAVQFTGYLSSDDKLPPALMDYRRVLEQVLEELTVEANGNFSAEILDPDAGDGALAQEIQDQYGFRPMAASLFDVNTFYFYLTLSDGGTLVQIPLPEALSADAAKRGIEEGLKRFASGLLRSVALSVPETPPAMMGMGMPPSGNQFEQLRSFLQADFNVESVNLTDGSVPDSADLLMVLDPDNLDDKAVFAIDQYLMKGGSVVLATSPFSATMTPQSLSATPRSSGLHDWLAHHGVAIDEALLMDPQNAAFPAPVTRQVGGFSFQEMVLLDYPYFIDVRGEGLNQNIAITAGLPQITVTWPSPLDVDEERNAGRSVTPLLVSSMGSWTTSDADIMPRLTETGLPGFIPSGEVKARNIAVLIEGRFESYFTDRPSPLLTAEDTDTSSDPEDAPAATTEDAAANDFGIITSVVDRSPESARLFVFASNSFLSDQSIRLVGSAEGIIYANSLQLMANVVDWSLEDQSLLEIRSRGHFNRTLPPLETEQQALLEYLNYGAALLGVALVFGIHRRRLKSLNERYRSWFEGVAS